MLGLWAAAVLWASPDTALARREVDVLLDDLRRSGCRFQRNGSWYDAAKAADHLARKRRYLEGHGGVPSAEFFIDNAGSESSWTGRPYQVGCPDRPVRPSREWLRERLRLLREGRGR